MDNLTSFVFGGFLIALGYIILQVVRKNYLVYIINKLPFLSFKSIFPQIISLSLLSFILIFTILINDFYTKEARFRLDSKIGPTNSIIYSRDKTAIINNDKISNIYSKTSNYYDKYLPIYQNEVSNISINNKNIENVLVINFDLISANTYFAENENKFFEETVIIPESLAKEGDYKVNDEIKLINGTNSIQVKIGQIIKDNGLIGFNLAIPSRLKEYKTSIYIPNSDIKKLFSNTSQTQVYNSLLLQTSSSLQQASNQDIYNLNQQLIRIDRDLVLEEMKISYIQKIFGTIGGLNISQIILLLAALPLLVLFILSLYFDLNYRTSIKSLLGTLKVKGLSDEDVNLILIFISFVKSIIASIISILLAYMVFYLSNLRDLLVANSLFEYEVDINTVFFVFSSTFLILFLLSNLFNLFKLSTKVYLPFFEQIKTEKKFKLSQNSLALMTLFGSITLLYYINSEFVKDENYKFIGNFYLIQILFSIISYIISKYYIEKRQNIFFLSIFLLFFVNLLPFFWLKEYFTFNPIVSGLSLLPAMLILPLFLIQIYSIALQISLLSKLHIPKSLVILKGYINKFSIPSLYLIILNLIFLFTFSLGFYLQDQIKTFQNNKSASIDIYLTDDLGFEEPQKVISEIENVTKISTYNFVALGKAEFTDFEISKLENYDQSKFPNLNPLSLFSDTVAFTNASTFKTINFDRKDEFFNSNKYIVLASNYANKDIISPKLKVGDKVKLQINNLNIEREVLAIIPANTENLETGIYLSQKDYEDLRKQKLYLSHSYGFDLFNDSYNLNQLNKSILGLQLSSKVIRNDLIQSVLVLVSQIIYAFTIVLFISYAVITIILTLWILSIYNSFAPSNFNLKSLKITFISMYFIFLAICSLIIGLVIFKEILQLIHLNIVVQSLPESIFNFDNWSIFYNSIYLLLINIFASSILIYFLKNNHEQKNR